MGDIVLVRHGETDWSREGRHTGRTDIPLNDVGEQQARDLAKRLTGSDFGLVLTSPLARARRTAELAGLSDARPDDDLVEWDYGEYEGMMTTQVQAMRPGWYLWRDGVPGGETIEQVAARADRVLDRIRAVDSAVAIVGHGHALRILAARWIEQSPTLGARLRLEEGTISTLSTEHDRPVLQDWNVEG